MRTRLTISICLAGAVALLASTATLHAHRPAHLDGYSDYQALSEQVRNLDQLDHVTIDSLGKTRGDRDVWAITISGDADDNRPALLIVGSAHAPQIVGSELAMALARRLAADDEVARNLRQRLTFYVVPRPNPDATEASFAPPLRDSTLNQRPIDDDNDGRTDEDGPDDLNDDGLITAMRIADPAGRMMPHPDDERVMIEADRDRGEIGGWRVIVEGIDDDGDGDLNEDPPGGVDFNRNFSFEYPFFEQGAGPHQVSEPETRGVADFALAHQDIAAVITFDVQDNLMQPWPAEPAGKQGRVKRKVTAADAAYLKHIAEQYLELQLLKDAPPAPPIDGSFARWAYFHFGRWSFAVRPWWSPATPEPEDQPDQPESKQPKDRRGAQQIATLRWLESQGIVPTVPWSPVQHPDFPGQRVEVGGMKPLLTLNPSAEQIEILADTQFAFLKKLAELLPSLAIEDVKVDALGGDVYRIGATIVNRGYLPTMPQMGAINGVPLRLQVRLALPEGSTYLTGHERHRLEPLAGSGGTTRRTWLIRTPGEAATITVWSPAVGFVTREVPLR